MEALDVPTALIHIFELVQRANKYIDETAPWVLAKNEADKPRLNAVLYNLCSALELIAALLQPYLPNTAPKMAAQLGVEAGELSALLRADTLGQLRAGYTVHKGEALFPRIDVKAEIAYLEAEDAKRKAAAETAAAQAAPAEKAEAPAAGAELIGEHEAEISFDDFCKVELRVAEIRACERMKESKKLLHLTVFDGERERCILSGIAKWFAPEDLIGKKVGIVANLAPRPMMKGKYVSEGHDRRRRHRYPGRLRRGLLPGQRARGCAHPLRREERNTMGHTSDTPAQQAAPSRIDAFFAVPAVAVVMAILCNAMWGSAFPFIKMGYRLFAIDAADTPSIPLLCGRPLHAGRCAGVAVRPAAGAAAAAHAPRPRPGCLLRPGAVADLHPVFFLLQRCGAAHRRAGRHPQQHPEFYGRHSGPFPLRQG